MTRDSGNNSPGSGSATTDPRRIHLGQLVDSLGEAVSEAGTRQVWLDEPGCLWFVERGVLDIYFASCQDGELEAPFRHIQRLAAGRFAFGAQGTGDLRLLAKGLPGTTLRRIPVATLTAACEGNFEELNRALAEDADQWIIDVFSTIAIEIEIRPRPDLALTQGLTTDAVGVLTSADGVVWAEGTTAQLFGTEESAEGELVPLTPDSWAVLHEPAAITVLTSSDLETETLLNRAIPGFHRMAMRAQALNRQLLIADQANLQMTRSKWRRSEEDQARAKLFGLLAPSSSPTTDGDLLLAALAEVGRHEGISIMTPEKKTEEMPGLAELLHASGVRARRVRLSQDENWWNGDSGAMLTFKRENGGPVALLPTSNGRYRLYDPETGRSSQVKRKDAGALTSDAWVLYGALPEDRPVGMRMLLSAAANRVGSDLVRLVCTGIPAAVLALAPAVGIGLLVNHVIPSGDMGELVQLVLLLVLLTVTAALFHMLRGMAIMRIEARLASRATAALWDRLLRLPNRFHRRFSSGELTMRALAFQSLRDRVSGTTAASLFSALFLIPSISLVFLYDALLGWLSLGIGIASLSVAVAAGAAQVTPQQRRFEEERVIAGQLSEIIRSIRKLKAAGAEGSARASWARSFHRQKLAEIRVGILSEHLSAFNAAMPLLAAAAFFSVALARGDELGVGEFLVAYVASMIFYASIVALGAGSEAISSIPPAGQQVLPILAATPDTARRTRRQVVLAGGIRFESVSFRYADSSPLILDRISIHADPGEYIAIVGESGAGKSTLARLAVGLESPTGGGVYFDDRDLAHLDLVSVRRQIGIVLQDGIGQAGTILDNITGLDPDLAMDDAWRAARQAAVDGDIAKMPMQMHTHLGEGASAVSGGQNQRIRVARAMVRNPRILILDEATNWLDPRNQSALMASISTSTATRIVIAHRLSTIRDAHRIYVLKSGKIAQIGRFEEVSGQPGPFSDLMHRQEL